MRGPAGTTNEGSGEQLATVNDGVEVCYETFGDPGRPTLLLIMGLGFQLVAWPDAFCAELAGRGFHVVRFDNRDVGRSSRLPGGRYTLEDMADDAVGLLDALGVGAAHVVGASMGGMIAQVMAVRHPDRVRSLASLMSSTGNRRVGKRSPVLLKYAFGRRPTSRDEIAERRVRVFAAVGSTGFEQDLEELRRSTLLALDRDGAAAGDRSGRRRQYAAVKRAGDRTGQLAAIAAPTVVIHGTADRMVHPSGGEATAAAIPGAELVMIKGLGHDVPPGAWPRIIDAVVRNAQRAP